MSLAPINWQPDRKTLAEFSEAWLFFLGMVAAPLAYFRGHHGLAATFWVLAVLGRGLGLIRPAWMKPAFVGLSLATWPIGWVVSNLAMILIYFTVFAPIGLVFRLIGRDVLNRRFDRGASTYWELHNPDRGLNGYLRQF